jgi:hypothetical protein
MPAKDGTGPRWGSGPMTGKGIGRGGRGSGRMGGTRAGAGPGGNCVCPACGAKAPHQTGSPCSSIKCPKCGTAMARE